jgi:FkbM family methyltransferase
MTASHSAAKPSARRGPRLRKVVARVAKRLGLTVLDEPGAPLVLSRARGFTLQTLVRNRDYVLSHRAEPPRLLEVRPGTTVVAAGAGSQRLSVHELDDAAWLLAAGQPRCAELGPNTWLVSRRRFKSGAAERRAALTDETQIMKHLGARHIAWLLHHYEINCVLDVGANVGQFANELRRHGYTGHIASFEPVPQFVEKLQVASAGDDRWTIHQMALGTSEGVLPIRVQHSLSSALTATDYGQQRFASLRKYADRDQIDVPLKRLDAVLDEVLRPVTDSGAVPRVFLKLDTQGFDLEAFRGLGERAKDIIGLQSEMALLQIYEGMPRLPEALATYEAAGFEVTGFFPVTREGDGRVIEYDCILARAEEFRP